MADTTNSIQTGGGGDYTTISGWEADSDVSAGRWIGEIDDSNDHLDESIVISGSTGTPDKDNFVWLKATGSNRPLGVYGGGSTVTDSSGHVFTVSEQFVVLEDIEIIQSGTGTSDECVRVTSGAEDLLISRSILRMSGTATSQQDGIYGGNYSVTVHVDNCILDNFFRGGIHAQNFDGSGNHIWNIDHCAVIHCGESDASQSAGGIAAEDSSSGTVTMNLFNNWSISDDLGGVASDFDEDTTGGAVTWTGTDNIAGDTSAEAKFTTSFDSVVLIDTDPVSGENVHIGSISGNDLSITDEDTETVTQNGATDRAGNESAPQTTNGTALVQDLSLDIAHVARGTTTVSIGPFEFVEAGAGLSVPIAYHHRQRL